MWKVAEIIPFSREIFGFQDYAWLPNDTANHLLAFMFPRGWQYRCIFAGLSVASQGNPTGIISMNEPKSFR